MTSTMPIPSQKKEVTSTVNQLGNITLGIPISARIVSVVAKTGNYYFIPFQANENGSWYARAYDWGTGAIIANGTSINMIIWYQ